MPPSHAMLARHTPAVKEVHVLWLTAGLGCDGDSVSITAATQPSIEDVVMGSIPGLPKVHLHNPVLAYEVGDEFMNFLYRAEKGQLDPFVLVLEGSVPNESIKSEGYWAARAPTRRPASRSRPTNGSIGSRPRPGPSSPPAPAPLTAEFTPWKATRPAAWAWPITWVGTSKPKAVCRSSTFRAVRCSPTISWRRCCICCFTRPDWRRRRRWTTSFVRRGCLAATVHEGCDRGGYYEQAQFATKYGQPECLVKLGCWGPVVNCNVTKRGWMAGIGGCPNVGGICIGCTMPGFPDKFMPFMDEPPGAHTSSTAISIYGRLIKALRNYTNHSANKEPKWRHRESDANHRIQTHYVRPGETISIRSTNHGHDHRNLSGSPGANNAISSRCRGIRSRASWAAWASSPRSTSTIARSWNATAPPRSFAATACS